MQIDFDFESLRGDLTPVEGGHMELLNCYEFILWYMLRQAGIPGYLVALRTHAFLSAGEVYSMREIPLFYWENMRMMRENTEKYYHLRFVEYTPAHYPDLHHFVGAGIAQGRAVYALYDNYYNSLDNDKYYLQEHSYHGHLLARYDEVAGKYIGLLASQPPVKYTDLEHMYAHCMEKFGEEINPYFYLEGRVQTNPLVLQREEIRADLKADLEQVFREWNEEIAIMEAYHRQISNVVNLSVEEQQQHILTQRAFFNSSTWGIHGNMLLKIRLIEQVMGVSLEDYYQRFLANRKQAVTIANMYGKAFYVLKIAQAAFYETVERIAARVKKDFIVESRELHRELQEIVGRFQLI